MTWLFSELVDDGIKFDILIIEWVHYIIWEYNKIIIGISHDNKKNTVKWPVDEDNSEFKDLETIFFHNLYNILPIFITFFGGDYW